LLPFCSGGKSLNSLISYNIQGKGSSYQTTNIVANYSPPTIIKMKATIKLFKALPIKVEGKKNLSEELLKKTIKRGFVFSPEVVHNYSNSELNNLITIIEKEIGLTGEQLNSSFHKSWGKIKDAKIEQLVFEQLIHYFTTYGFERLGIYDESSVYIPNEKLEIPELDEDIKLTLIKGYTKEELKEKLLTLLNSGIALKEDTISDVTDVALFLELNEEEIESIRNKETKIILYDYLNLVPENPVEFLRYLVYQSTNKTLLIKNKAVIEEIKFSNNVKIAKLFLEYKNKFGLEKLAEIFYRFKPIFLAFRTNVRTKYVVNRIRRLARKYHKPMKEDYLNSVTSKINKEPLDKKELETELNKVNIFRKIRLAYALKYRTKDTESILYRIRNGKGYAKEFNFEYQKEAKDILDTVLDSIIKDMSKNIKGKKIFMPKHITYTLPATEKQFTGNFPSGSYISVPNDMIFGIYWENVNHDRIDLDLSLINLEEGKIGWDSSYRTKDRGILFSGDITNAPRGASELFYIKGQLSNPYIMLVNYYNYEKDVKVPFKILVAKEKVDDFKQNYIVNPNNVLSIAKSEISQKENILGLVEPTTEGCRFYFAETSIGKSITSSGSEFVENARKYLFDFYRDTINLKDVLEKAGTKFVDEKEDADIDLSPENLEKDTILNLLVKN